MSLRVPFKPSLKYSPFAVSHRSTLRTDRMTSPFNVKNVVYSPAPADCVMISDRGCGTAPFLVNVCGAMVIGFVVAKVTWIHGSVMRGPFDVTTITPLRFQELSG